MEAQSTSRILLFFSSVLHWNFSFLVSENKCLKAKREADGLRGRFPESLENALRWKCRQYSNAHSWEHELQTSPYQRAILPAQSQFTHAWGGGNKKHRLHSLLKELYSSAYNCNSMPKLSCMWKASMPRVDFSLICKLSHVWYLQWNIFVKQSRLLTQIIPTICFG